MIHCCIESGSSLDWACKLLPLLRDDPVPQGPFSWFPEDTPLCETLLCSVATPLYALKTGPEPADAEESQNIVEKVNASLQLLSAALERRAWVDAIVETCRGIAVLANGSHMLMTASAVESISRTLMDRESWLARRLAPHDELINKLKEICAKVDGELLREAGEVLDG